MAKLLNYMVVHKDPDISWDKIEENYPNAARLKLLGCLTA